MSHGKCGPGSVWVDSRNAALMSPEELCALWREEAQRLYGDAVEFLPLQRWNWAAIPHFFHYRFNLAGASRFHRIRIR